MSPTCQEDGCQLPHHAKGYCGPHYRRWKGYKSRPHTPSENARQALRKGITLGPPRTLPYRAIARTCRDCGRFITTPDHLLRRDAGPLPACPSCRVQRVFRNTKARRQVDPIFDAKVRKRVQAGRRRLQAELAPLATNNGKEWTGPEMELLLRDDLSASVLARMLGRSLYAVKNMRRKVREPRGEALAGVDRAARDRETQRVADLVTRRRLTLTP